MVRLDHLVRAWASGEHSVPLKQAQRRIRSGEVTVDGAVCIEPKYQVLPWVELVACGGAPVPTGTHSFCLMHKPAGHVCQRDPTCANVYELIPAELQCLELSACGRLDRDTTGMLLFATDGGVQSMLLHPMSRVWKTYTAELEQPCATLHPEAEALFRAGMVLEDGLSCAPAFLEVLGPSTVRVRVHEGHFHQVKRMIAHCRGTVKSLHRDAFGELADPELPAGAMRPLTAAETRVLLDMLPLERVTAREMTDRHAPPPTKRSRAEGPESEEAAPCDGLAASPK